MALDVKELCRLCGKKDDFSKDLKDEDNKNILKMIQEVIQIPFAENDELPTRVCIICEEKIVSFQLFILECFKVQETLRQMCLETCEKYPIKLEHDIVIDFNIAAIKSEVKHELSAEDLVNAINSDECMTGFDADDYNNDNDDDDMSDVNLATLKDLKQKKTSVRKRMKLTETGKKHLKEILKKSDLNTGDFVKFQCNICNKPVKAWSELRAHYTKIHKSKPELFCVCGFIITSRSSLYRHVSDHRSESSKLKKNDEKTDSDKQDENKYSNLNVSDFVNFTCSICQKQCTSWYQLKSHSERLHKIKPVVNCICGITLKSKSVLYKHVSDHKNPNVICCDKCPRTTKTLSAMSKHKMRHIPKSERKFCCSSCDKEFTSKETLRYHVRTHIPIEERKIYSCDLCELKFTTPSAAASHKRVVHDKIKSYMCDLCGYACGTCGELRQHRAIHSDDKPFACRKCDKRFKTYSNLKTHMDTHEDTSYVCYVCSRVLNSRRTLRKHLLVHDDQCRHVCSYCNKAFKRRQTLKVHMYTHTGDKPLTCKWCDERFSYASTLRSHRLRCHPDKMAAQYCAYNTHVSVPEGYLKNDAVPPKTDVEAI